jgi:hypothetical protein
VLLLRLLYMLLLLLLQLGNTLLCVPWRTRNALPRAAAGAALVAVAAAASCLRHLLFLCGGVCKGASA